MKEQCPPVWPGVGIGIGVPGSVVATSLVSACAVGMPSPVSPPMRTMRAIHTAHSGRHTDRDRIHNPAVHEHVAAHPQLVEVDAGLVFDDERRLAQRLEILCGPLVDVGRVGIAAGAQLEIRARDA